MKPAALKLSRECIRKGVEVDVYDKVKQTPLYYAAKVGILQVARLISLGMHPNFQDIHRQTAVFYAVLRAHLQMRLLAWGPPWMCSQHKWCEQVGAGKEDTEAVTFVPRFLVTISEAAPLCGTIMLDFAADAALCAV